VQGPLQTSALPGAAKAPAEDAGDGEAAKVVTLDAFRKK
jgi:hypothetical protein